MQAGHDRNVSQAAFEITQTIYLDCVVKRW